MKRERFSIRKRIRSFGYAFCGMRTLVRDEHNARIHLTATVVAVSLGFVLGISRWEWCAVALCIGAVLMAEAMNSAVEALADLVSPEWNPLVKKAKDVAAAGVLFMAVAAVAVGLLVFLPYLFNCI